MISSRKIHALCAKDAKSLLHNVFILSGILIIPVMAFVFNLMADEFVIDLVLMIVQMNVLMNGANIICVMIAEEKEKHTLNVLVSSTVSGLDFLLSKLLVSVVLTMAVSVAVYFMFDLMGIMAFGQFMLITGVAVLPAAAIGAIIGITMKTQAAASSAVAPLFMVFMFLPMLVPRDSAVWNVLQYLFPEQMVLGLIAVYRGEAFMTYIGFILANFAVLFVAFLLVYRKKGLSAG